MSRRHRALILYVAIAYGITWAIWSPYVQAARAGLEAPGPFLYYLAAFGPFAGAVLAEWYERGTAGVSDLLGRLIDFRRPRWWTIVGLASPLLLIPLSLAPVYFVSGVWPAWSGTGVTGRAPGLTSLETWLLMTASYGIGEEVGWRGFLLPRLQTGRSALRATLLLSTIWAVWHVPAFWFREGYVGLGLVGIIGFLVGLVAGAIVLTAL